MTIVKFNQICYQRPGRDDCLGNRFVTVIDKSGIHHLPVVKCLCPNAPEEHLQYLELGLFPSSYQIIKTVFTFGRAPPADFRLSNLECKTTAYQYYSKLRRLTCPAFPKMVLNRYTELRRLSRQYRNLKTMENAWPRISGHRATRISYSLARQRRTLRAPSKPEPLYAASESAIGFVLCCMSTTWHKSPQTHGRRTNNGGFIFANFVPMGTSRLII